MEARIGNPLIKAVDPFPCVAAPGIFFPDKGRAELLGGAGVLCSTISRRTTIIGPDLLSWRLTVASPQHFVSMQFQLFNARAAPQELTEY